MKKYFAPLLISLFVSQNSYAAYTPPAGTLGQWQYNAGNNSFGGQTLSGDCTVVYTTGVVTCTKTNGVAFATSATTDTTNATNISSGSLVYARLPALTANQVLGALTATTPSGLSVPSCSGATNALIWTSGTGFGCNTISGGGGVSSFTGDGVIISNSASTGAVTDTLVNAAANSVLGNNTATPTAPAYQTSINLTGTAATAAHTITSASATSLIVGANGATNPVLAVDDSTASVVTGVAIKGAATGVAATITATDSASSSPLTLSSKLNGQLNLIVPGGGAIVINSNSGIDEFQIGGSNRFTQQAAVTSITPAAESSTANSHFTYTGAADSALTASTESISENWNNSQIRQHSTGALTLQRDFVVTGSTNSFSGASTLTDGATLGFSLPGCGTNATCTDLNGIYHASTALTVTGTTTNSYGINIASDTGATNNYAAKFIGDVQLAPPASLPVVSTCGSGSLVTGSSDNKGQISGIIAATACTITFAYPLSAAPSCIFNTNSAIVPTISTISTAAVTTTMTALTGTLYYICF